MLILSTHVHESPCVTINFSFDMMTMQVPKVWEDELHNVVQMSYGTTAPSSSQDPDGV